MRLFSTTHYHGSKEYIPYEKSVKITEHRAPTDESVALLNEFTEKARQNIVDSIQIKNNVIDCAVVYYQDDIISDCLRYYVKFRLNGVEHKLNGHINRMDLQAQTAYYRFRHEGVMMMVYEELAKNIAAELIKASPDSTNALARLF